MKGHFFVLPRLRRHARIVLLSLIVTLVIGRLGFSEPAHAQATGVNWPATQMFPSFRSFTALDVMDLSGLPDDQKILFITLEGLVNRTQTRIYALDNWGEGKTYWLDRMVATGVTRNNIASPFTLITKYRSELQGIIIYDPNFNHTINLATTIAGVRGAIVASPALAPTLNAAPYNLPTLVDLRTANGGGAFTSALQTYQYAFDNYWSQTTHRIFFGLQPGMTDVLRDYVVGVQGMVVWLNPGDAAELALLNRFWDGMPPVSPYVGWWPDEPAGVRAASLKGLPVFAADWLANASVFGGTSRTINIPAVPPTPPLQNKIYVMLLMSDGDNIQENQHLSPIKWADPNRGRVPLSWTFSAADLDIQPIMLNHFYSIATANDAIVSGPSGVGYTYPSYWPTGWLTRYARMSNQYLNATGMRVITLWNNGNTANATVQSIYTQQMPRLLGMPLQDGGLGVKFNWSGTLPTIVHQHGYANNQAEVEGAINAIVASWNGTQPAFVSVQGNLNQGVITPTLMYNAMQKYSGNTNVVFVRGDHFFQLMRQANGLPVNPVGYSYEAESSVNTLSGTPQVASCLTASGGQIVRHTTGASSLQFNQVNVATAGTYKLSINYFNGDAATLPALMNVNGGAATTLNFPSQSIGWCDQGVYHEGMFTTLVQLNAGNNTIRFSSPNSTYSPDYDSIVLAPSTAQPGYWALNETSGTTAMDSSGNGKHGTLNGAPTWTSGRVNGALNFNGAGDFVAVNSGTINTLYSYSISAWVQLSQAPAGYVTAVSQDGTNISSFFLQYSGALGNKFAFSVLNSDSTTAAVTRAISTTTPTVGTWYHLIAVRDAAANQIKLYVNGVLEATQALSGGWSAPGNTMIGRAKWGGANVDFWPGKLDEVRAFNYALSDSEIATLYNVATTVVPTNTPAPPTTIPTRTNTPSVPTTAPPTNTRTNTPSLPTNTSVPPTATIPPSTTNLALNKPATASASCNANEGAAKAVNGTVTGGNTDKWCDNTSASKWLQVDLLAAYSINQFIVRHAGAGGESATLNTNAFNIQVSTDNATWTTVVTITGNTANVTTHSIAARNGRYVRLNITNSGGDSAARIYEFEVYGSSTGTPVPPTATRTRTNTPVGATVTPTRTNTRTNTPTSGFPAWAPNTFYAVGANVSYSGRNYRCTQAHTSLVGWEPPNAPALWTVLA